MIDAWAIVLTVAMIGQVDLDNSLQRDAAPVTDARAALSGGDYPWYDADRDAVRPILSDPDSWTTWIQKRFNAVLDWLRAGSRNEDERAGDRGSGGFNLIPMTLMLLAGALFVFILWRLWQLHATSPVVGDDLKAQVGEAVRIAGLGPGMSLEGVDPWAEAERRRISDPGGAIIWLFVDQLVGLQRAGLIRRIPGRTGRQYARSLGDPLLADSLNSTLTAFEDVYYGRRLPRPEVIEDVWARAEVFRKRLRELESHV